MNENCAMSPFERLIMLIVAIPFLVKELFWPSQSKPTDFKPIGKPVFREECFYLRFPCLKYQRMRTAAVIDFWKNTAYTDHNDEFVFVESMFGETYFSNLTIRFRKHSPNNSITINVYDSIAHFNIQINQQQLVEIENFRQYLQGMESLSSEDKAEYDNTLENICNKKSPGQKALRKLLAFIAKNRDNIGTIADVTSIISTVLGFFEM